MELQTGIFPFVGIVLLGCLYAVFRLVVRLKCGPRAGQWYVILATVGALVVTFVRPVRVVQPVESDVSEPVVITVPVGHAVKDVPMETRVVMQKPAQRQAAEPAVSAKSVFTLDVARFARALYIIGMLAVLLYFAVQLLWLLRVRLNGRLIRREGGVGIYSTTFSSPFSFGRSIYLPDTLDSSLHRYVVVHELSHVRHGHSFWLCLVSLLTAMQWFNPFAWMLLDELRLQQEMEVDGDVMESGVDREDYQMSLLRVCVGQSRWVLIQTGYGMSDLKRRILFMNSRLCVRSARRRMWLATIAALLVVGSAAALSCGQRREKSPMDGCWTMDWIRNAEDKFEHVPSLYNNLFYGNDMQINFSWFSRYGGVNMHFNFSGERMPYRGGHLYNAKGDSLHIRMPDERTYWIEWHKDSDQTTLVAGPDIVEQWHRVTPDKDVMRLLQALRTADSDRSHPVCGTWQGREDDEHDVTEYFVVNGDLFFRFAYFHSDKEHLRRSAGGWCGDFRCVNDSTVFLSDRNATVEWTDKDHIRLSIPRDEMEPGRVEVFDYERAVFPDDLRRLLAAAFPE